MNIQRKNSAHHFRMQSEREQTLGLIGSGIPHPRCSPPSCVIFRRKSGCTYFTENFSYTIYIYIYVLDKNVNESTTVCSLRSLSTRKMVPITGRARSFLVFGVFKRKGDRTTDLSIYPTL